MGNTPKNNINRRSLLLPIASLLLSTSVVLPVFAEGPDPVPSRRRRIRRGRSSTAGNCTSAKKINRWTKADFTRAAKSKHTPPVCGFTLRMSRSIYIMGSNDRRATQRLIRDMSKLKSKAARLKRLKQEIKNIEKEVAQLNASLKRLESKSGSHRAINSEGRRLTQVSNYRNHVFRWERAPMEGTK